MIKLFAGVSGTASNAVDIFNANNGAWSTAVLSFARYGLSATSVHVQGLALFAGGVGAFNGCLGLTEQSV